MARAQKRFQPDRLHFIRHIEWLSRVGIRGGPIKGYTNQQRCFDLLTGHLLREPRPLPWVTGIRVASVWQDLHMGIDIIVESDVGNLFLQVKSSEEAKLAFEKRSRERLEKRRTIAIIRVIVVNESRPDQGILRDAVRALKDLHQNVGGHGSSYARVREIP